MSAVAVDNMAEEIKPWELHSELTLVSPEVGERALELLPERDPDAFLARLRASAEAAEPGRATVVLRYTLWRFGQTARFGVAVTIVSVGIALIAEAVR